MKTCSKCKLEKPEEEFYLQGDTGKRQAACKKCHRVYQKNYHEENREEMLAGQRAYNTENQKDIAARKRLYNYGITSDAFKRMIANQGGKCAICNREVRLCVDHDHKTGKVRGLLCLTCNRGIGLLKDSSDMTRRATEYLKNYES